MPEKSEKKMIDIYVMGRRYRVPEGLTIMTALEYAGYKYVRGCGCRGGFCGACSTVYRYENDYKLKMDLACQTAVEDGMFLVQLPFVPSVRTEYEIDDANPKDNDNILLEDYPEIARCVSCNTCTKACPQDIEVMDYVQAALRGDIHKAATLSFDCIQCGLCSIRCPADIKHYHLAQEARRIKGKYIDTHSEELKTRINELDDGTYDDKIDELASMSREDIKKVYDKRDFKKEGK